jgi:type VI secretion system protein ImpE
MSPKELLEAGHLASALRQVTEQVQANPEDLRLRTFLFELLCMAGELEEARHALAAIAQDGANAEIAVQRYFSLLTAEEKRRKLFSHGVRPKLPYPCSYAETQLNAVNELRVGHRDRALELLEAVEGERGALPGRLNGADFEDFKDADDLIGPFLEVAINDDYCWFPWECVKSFSLPEPRRLRDLFWSPAVIELHSGSSGEAFVPVLYAGSYQQDDEQIKLGRATTWRTDVSGISTGVGQKLFALGDRDCAILEIRQLEFQNANAGDNS